MAFDFSKILTAASFLIIIIIVITIMLVKKNVVGKENKEVILNKSDKTLRIIGIALNFIWVILFIPAAALCLMAGISTIMMTDSGKLNTIQTILVFLITLLFWATPIAAIISVILSFKYRKREKYLLSVIVQAIPLVFVSALFAFIIL